MSRIYICHCGCQTEIWKDGCELLIISGEIQERIESIDLLGLINGKYSISIDGLKIVAFEMRFR